MIIGCDMSNLFDEVLAVLRQDERFIAEDGTFLRNAVCEAALKMDKALIHLLLNNEVTYNRFFTDIDGVIVFDKQSFAWFVNNRQFLPDSYTRFKNKIGLVDETGEYISQSGKVELVFPYKDCILEGGQTKEDQKRDEIFYNETLAQDEVDRLLYPKVFTNAKRYTKDGVEEDITFRDDDNLIIKGNNLLAISSLLKRYEGKIKLIYIDPPYNTGNDSFGYNDSFNRATWLTFIKNRLVIAKQLLSQEGAIYMQLDYHQVHYAKIVMDEIFGEENFQREIIWRIGWLSGYKTADRNWIRNHDTILFYSRNKDSMRFIKNYIQKEDFKSFVQKKIEQYPIEDVWNASEYDDLNSIAIVSFSGETVSKMLNPEDEVKGQKSEKLIERIIKAHTNKGDIILDFFGGTGTTGAVALKTGRNFIVCEQMDKHIDIMLRRLQKAMEGEQSGVSRKNQWQGGGSFVYCELAKLNQTIVEKIEDAKDEYTLSQIYDKMLLSGFISHKVDPKDIKEGAEEYQSLSLDEKKRFLMEILDKNLLYVNYCDIDDEEFNISESDNAFTHSFYNKGN